MWNCIFDSTASSRINDRIRKDSYAFLDGAVKYQANWRAEHHTVFDVACEPNERFISSIGQATRDIRSIRNGAEKRLMEGCIKKTAPTTLQCFLNLVKNKGTWIEVHFTPTALEISFLAMYKDTPVAVFPSIRYHIYCLN